MANKTLKKILRPGEKKKKQKIIVLNAIKKLVAYIEANCLELEGICRISGNAIKVKELKKSLENEEDIDFGKILDKHVISGALKMFLREMDEPILTFDLYKNFLGSYDIRDKNAKVAFFKSLLTALPKENFEILQIVLKLLYTLQMYHEKNKMTSVNLAIVFAPTLLRPKEESFETMMNATNYTTDIVKSLIEEFNVLYELNTTILYKLSKSELTGKEEKKSIQEQLEEAQQKIELLLKQSADEANERSVLETYAHQTNNRLEEEIELRKMTLEEKEGLSELIEELKEKNKLIEEKNQQQSNEIMELKQKLEDTISNQSKMELEITEINKKRNEIEQSNKLQKQEMDKQSKQMELDKKRLKELDDQSVNEKKRIRELEDQIKIGGENDRKRIKELEDQSINEKKRIKELDDQLLLQSNNNKSKKQTVTVDHSKEIDQLKKDLKSKNDQLQQLTKDNNDLTKKYKDLEIKKSSNTQQPSTSSSSSSSSTKEIEELKKKLKDQDLKISNLEKELKTSTSQQSTVSTGSFVIGKKPKKEKLPEKPPVLQDEDDITSVKQFAFYWLILSLKTDAMAHGKNCNISSSDTLDELLSKKIRVNQWNEYVLKKLKEVE